MTLAKTTIGKLIVILTALLGASWAGNFLCNLDQGVQLNKVSNAVLSGAGFKRNPVSEAALSEAEYRHICSPREVRAATIIRLRLYELAIDSLDTRLADERLHELDSSVKQALRCVPSDGLLWFIEYWGAVNRGGEVSKHLGELRMSYKLAPYEGWIALRSPFVLAIYDVLPADIQESACKEFTSIVRTGLIRDAVRILKGAGWRHRDILLAGLGTVRIDFRVQLDRALRAEGLFAEIPGIDAQEFRPWR